MNWLKFESDMCTFVDITSRIMDVRLTIIGDENGPHYDGIHNYRTCGIYASNVLSWHRSKR